MQTSENGIAFIKKNEGYARAPYNDNGKLCWGYGHDQQAGEPEPVQISEPDACVLLVHDLASRYEPAVNALVPADCTQNQFDALVDFAYNLGVASLRMMVAHGWDQVPDQALRWNHVAGAVNVGLTARRQAEVDMFKS